MPVYFVMKLGVLSDILMAPRRTVWAVPAIFGLPYKVNGAGV